MVYRIIAVVNSTCLPRILCCSDIFIFFTSDFQLLLQEVTIEHDVA